MSDKIVPFYIEFDPRSWGNRPSNILAHIEAIMYDKYKIYPIAEGVYIDRIPANAEIHYALLWAWAPFDLDMNQEHLQLPDWIKKEHNEYLRHKL